MAFPSTYNFNYYRGDTFTFTVSPKGADGNSFSLAATPSTSAYLSKMTVIGGTNNAIKATIDTSIDYTTNVITATISPSLRSTLVPGVYDYDLEIYRLDTAGSTIDKVYTLLAGRITVVADITETTIGA
jgi:hypothetical protein